MDEVALQLELILGKTSRKDEQLHLGVGDEQLHKLKSPSLDIEPKLLEKNLPGRVRRG